MATCAGIKRDGGRCTATVEPPQEYCFWHDPESADKRRRAASKGGKGKASKELPKIKALLEDLTDRVLSGELETGPASVANQLINTRLRALEAQRKQTELEDVLMRIEALEREREHRRQRGVNRW